MAMLRIAFAVAALALVSSAAVAQGDDFNRPNSTNMGPNWTEVAGDWRIENNRARSQPAPATDLMIFNPWTSPAPYVEAEVYYEGSARVTYAALVCLYANLSNNLFVKVQDNNANGDFERVFFYYGNNGSAWPGMTGGPYYVDVTPFTQARIWTVVSGNNITLNIDRDMNGVPEDVLTRGGFPTGSLGVGVGLGGYNNASFDNFRVPEPASLTLLGLALLLVRRR
jgi:hypothetical protein